VMEGNAIETQEFLQAGAGRRIDRIIFGDTLKLDDRLRH
jgi:hypothetical protein